MGRHRKEVLLVIEEMTEQVKELTFTVCCVYNKMEVLSARLNYWLKKVEENEARAKTNLSY